MCNAPCRKNLWSRGVAAFCNLLGGQFNHEETGLLKAQRTSTGNAAAKEWRWEKYTIAPTIKTTTGVQFSRTSTKASSPVPISASAEVSHVSRRCRDTMRR